MRSLMAGSVVLMVVGLGVMASDAVVGQRCAAVAGRLMSSAELQRLTGANSTGPCKDTSDCSRAVCQNPGGECSYCSGSGMDQICAGESSSCTATTAPNGCGQWMFNGACSTSNRCQGGTPQGKPCPKTTC